MLKIHTHRSLGASEFKSSLKYEAANVEKKKENKGNCTIGKES